MATRRSLTTLAVVSLIVVAGAVVVDAARSQSPTEFAAVSPTPTAMAAPAASPFGPAAPSASAALPPGTFENAVLGYRITLPVAYRRMSASVNPGATEVLGGESYTTSTAEQVRDDCRTGAGQGVGGLLRYGYVTVQAHRNPDGLSAAKWAPGSPYSTHAVVEPAVIAGYDAARLVQGGEVRAYVLGANARMYVLSRSGNAPAQVLADAAESFRAVTPAPLPAPTVAPVTRREGATQLAQHLAQAFAAKDADAIGALMTDCRMISTETIAGAPLGTDHFPSRFAPEFIDALRGHFARGELTVTVDPNLQQHPVSGEFSIASQWREATRTTRIDLLLGERDGRWLWHAATHHFPSRTGDRCIRSPWVASSC